MTSLLRSVLSPAQRPAERALTIDGVAEIMRAGGYVLQSQVPSLAQPREEIGYDYQSYIYGILRANPIVFAAINLRARVFAQARFRYRRIVDGEPGEMFGTRDLELLEQPEPTQVTADLLKRASFDEALAGNWFAVRRPSRIKRLRPDWCWLIIGSPNADSIDPRDPDAEVVGLAYRAGGYFGDGEMETFSTAEFAHFAPIPDPIVGYRGMSWLTPVVRDVEGDQAMSLHKLMFMRNGATPSVTVKFPLAMSQEDAAGFIELFEQEHRGVLNAYKTVYLGGGADLTIVGKDMQQIDFKAVQGASETRIAVASGVPAVLLGISEGLQGSSLNTGNYTAAKKNFADTTMRDLWATMSAALENILPPPAGGPAEMWYDERHIPFLAEDASAAAAVQSQQAGSIRTLVDGGFEPAVVIDAITTGDLRRLSSAHTGLLPVQLQPPGAEAPAEETSDEEAEPEEEATDTPMAALARQILALMPAAEEVRCTGCSKLLAELAAPPYRYTCRCGEVTERTYPKVVGWLLSQPDNAELATLLLAYKGQPRDARGRFGKGGGPSTVIGVSRERPDLGHTIETYDDLEAARADPVIAKAEATTTRDLEELGIDVASQKPTAGVFEGSGEPSLRVELAPGASLEDTEVAGAYLVRRNEQDSVIVTVRGQEMAAMGVEPNSTTLRVEGLPTDLASRDELFVELQRTTPFAVWDEAAGTIEVSSFPDDLTPERKADFISLADRHGGTFSNQGTHTRWYFQHDAARDAAREYLHPRDDSVLRTPDEVAAAYPGSRTAAIPEPRRDRAQDGGGGGARAQAPGGAGPRWQGWRGDPRAQPEGASPLELAYKGQPRDARGRFGSGTGGGAAVGGHSRAWMPPAQAAAVEAAEASIIGNTEYETAVVIGADGTQLLRKDGQIDAVYFSDEEIAAWKGKDAVLTHNHPSGGALSGDDLAMGATGDLAAVRQVGKRVEKFEDVSIWETKFNRGQELPGGGVEFYSEARRPPEGWLSPSVYRSAHMGGNEAAYKHFNEEISKAKASDPQGYGKTVMWARQEHGNRAMEETIGMLKRTFAGGAEKHIPIYSEDPL